MVIASVDLMTLLVNLLSTLVLAPSLGLANQPYDRALLAPRDSSDIAGLPLIELAATRAPGPTMAVILSGDGGWAAGDKQMAAALTEHGIPVVGLDVPAYLAIRRTPDEAAADLTRLLKHYLTAWHMDHVILIGYSHGADIAPFMVSRLSQDLRNRVSLLAMLGLESRTSFEFHLADMVVDISHKDDLPVLPEVEKLRGLPMLCVQGSGESQSLCAALTPSLAMVETRPGGHRITGRQGRSVVDLILGAISQPHP